MKASSSKIFYICMGTYWMGFGLITTFYPDLMGLFQTDEGIAAGTAFSDHLWLHDGLDILGGSVLLLALSTVQPSRTMLRAASVVALGPTIGITSSLVATPFWAPIFLLPGLGCFAFFVWGWLLSRRFEPVISH